jgi:SAM-dependent methyltransferase
MLDVAYDAELYLRLAHQSAGAVLELGVGSGRLAIPLALAGHDVVGVDHDAAMLERAERSWDAARGPVERGRLRLVEGDLSTRRDDARFGLVFAAVNTFLLAPDGETRRAVLTTMRDHLLPGGRAVIEVSTPDAEELAGFDGRLRKEWTRHDAEIGADVEKRMAARFDPGARSVTLHQVFSWQSPGASRSTVSRTDTLHLVSAAELTETARTVGFGEVVVWGDHLTTPYGAGSHRAILVARLL